MNRNQKRFGSITTIQGLIRETGMSTEEARRLQLTREGIIPYYIFQCRPVGGVGHRFQVPLIRGIRIVDDARGDQNGQAKCVRYVMSHHTGKIEIVGMADERKLILKYLNAKNEKDRNRIFTAETTPDQCWLE